MRLHFMTGTIDQNATHRHQKVGRLSIHLPSDCEFSPSPRAPGSGKDGHLAHEYDFVRTSTTKPLPTYTRIEKLRMLRAAIAKL